MAFYISGPKLLFETTEFDSTGVKLYIFIHNEVRDFDKNSTQPEIRVNRIRDNESQLYIYIYIYIYIYRILRTIGQYFFSQYAGFDLSSTLTYTRMKLKKSGIPKKKSR